MGVASRLSKMFSKAEVEKMDKAAKKAAGSPGFDDDTIAAQKEYAKEKAAEKSKKLTKKEEKSADKAAEEFAMGKEGTKKKAKPLTDKEKKEMQESLNFKKGGMVKKMAKGGMVKCGASNPPSQKAKMAYGGMAMKKGK
jgi:hypothetical protein